MSDYDQRAMETLLWRLIEVLEENHVISEYDRNQLLYPSIDDIERAEQWMPR